MRARPTVPAQKTTKCVCARRRAVGLDSGTRCTIIIINTLQISDMRAFVVLTILALTTTITNANGAGCVSGLPEAVSLMSMAQEIVTDATYNVTYATQYLFTSVVFNCSGAITGWSILAVDGSGGARPEISVWRPQSGSSEYSKVQGYLMDNCRGEEEVVEGTEVYWNEGDTTELLHFQQGDILGLLVRRQQTYDYIPLLTQTDNTTGYSGNKNGPYEEGHILTLEFPVELSPLISLKLCVNSSGVDDDSYPNCLNITLPENTCSSPDQPTSTPSPSPPSSSSSSSPLSTWVLVVVIAVPGVVVLLVIGIVLVVSVGWCVYSERRDKMDTSTHPVQPPSTLPRLSYNTDFHPNGDATHTYETPLGPSGSTDTRHSLSRETRPSVAISLTGAGRIDANFSGSVIANNSRSRSHTQASVYEEPRVSISQYESVEDEPTYDAPVNPPGHVHPPTLSQPNTPHLVFTPPPYSSPFSVSPVYHTLERPLHTPSPSPPQHRAARSVQGMSPLAINGSSHSRSTSYDSTDGTESRPGQFSQLPPGYQIIKNDDSDLTVNSGIYVPTRQQRSQFTFEPIFDDNVYSCLKHAPDSPLAYNWSFFEETDHYWKPASDSTQLYHQLHAKKYREVNRKQVQITNHLGSGEFGTVCRGFWHTNRGSLEVAVKTANNQVVEADKVRFLQEAAIMGQFRHPNIVRLFGVVTVSDPVLIVLELMKKGDLKTYLKTLRPTPGELVLPEVQHRLLTVCSEVALGMEYLARKDFVHRDLAARNILLTDDYTCKIADFGMSRDLDDDDYYISNGGKIPFKWTSPEALHYRKYSTASDVWSYGILLWEIWSLGHTPYKDCQTPDEATSKLSNGSRMLPPPGCPRALYHLMIQCWSTEPYSRPTFSGVLQALREPSSQVLHWAVEDRQSHPQAACLGATMEAGHNLYPDLQIMHATKHST